MLCSRHTPYSVLKKDFTYVLYDISSISLSVDNLSMKQQKNNWKTDHLQCNSCEICPTQLRKCFCHTELDKHASINTVPLLSLPHTGRVTIILPCCANLEPSGQKSRPLSKISGHIVRPSPISNAAARAKLRRAIWPPFRGPHSLPRIIRKEAGFQSG